MYQKGWLKKKKQKVRVLAAALAFVLGASLPELPVYGAVYDTQAGENVNGTIGFVTEKVAEVADAGDGNALCSVTAALRQYDWDCYSNDYYYGRLSAKEQLLYERLDAACGELLTTNKDAASYHLSSGTTRRGTKMVSSLGLTSDQVKKVQALFVYSNPQYYFLNTILLTSSSNQCALGIYDAFADGSSRASATASVKKALEQLQANITSGTVYDTDKQIHDLLCDQLVYLDGDDVLSDYTDPYYTQSIYGALTSGGTVCAGYTKLYAMLCSYFGIDCISITSTDHAWNEVRYGDQWYVVDVTWDDTGSRYQYFHLTDAQMTAKDQNSAHVPYSFYDGVRPVADTAFADSLQAMEGLEQPQVTLTDTAAGVTIALEAAAGDIYYTLDGTIPGADDKYTEPIALTSGGTYIVTTVAAGEGMLSSAYEIFPVRIAGGSVSVSSAVNTSGKKIKVKLKTSKTYTGFEISYASKKDFRNQKTAKITGKSATISGLKKGTTYYIRVRGYRTDAYGNYYYTAYSKTKAVKIKK
jgi:hypothetical protein